MPKVKVADGVELSYEDIGNGEKYVLSLMMEFPPENTLRELAKHGYHVLLITNRGFGASTHVFEDYGAEWFNVFADDVAAAADALGIDRFIYAGCSHGAGTGWPLALRHPERLIAFIDMAGGPHNIDEGIWSYRTMGDKAPQRKPMDPPTYEDPAVARRDARNAAYRETHWREPTPEEKAVDYKRPLIGLGTEEKVCAALRTIRTPTLMLGGIEDPISRPDLMLRTAECLPHGKLVLYSGFGHSGPFGQLIEECLEEILNFLRNVETTGRVYKEIVDP